MFYLQAIRAVAAVVIALAIAQTASAHHLMGGEMPSTTWQGLLSGLGHPIIGVDHVAFVIGCGVMAQVLDRPFLLPLLFVAGTIFGCLLHVQGNAVSWSEPAITLTIAVAAIALAMRARPPLIVIATLLTVAGALHGYAYGESIVGAETTPLTAYIIGFAVIQYCIAVGSGVLLRLVIARNFVSEPAATRLAGGALLLVAAISFGLFI
jgi:urease accessory protein